MPNVVCPICKSKAKPLGRTGDAEGFDCPRHQQFKVVGTVFSLKRTEERTSDEWEKALMRAKRRTKPGEWPTIKSEDFDG
jgi:hypothetical protein